MTEPNLDELVEKLAAIEHERWADWQKWVHKQLVWNGSKWELDPAIVMRWGFQIDTPYTELSEHEKQSDRDQVYRYLPLIATQIQEARIDELERLLKTATRTYRQTITDSNGNIYSDDTHGYISRYEAQERLAQLRSTPNDPR